LTRHNALWKRSQLTSGRSATPADINRNGRPTSIGTGGRHQSECPADIIGIRMHGHNAGMIYGYARVSTAAQDETGQVRQLKAAGCEKVFREKITGTTADRPQLKALMKRLAPGDVVITPAVDRPSRDTTDLLVIARDMQRAGAGIR
jgi:hypothetical protein